MKGKDLYSFYFVIIISIVISPFVFDKDFKKYSELITFLSIIIGFTITTLAIIYGSPLTTALYDSPDKNYYNKLKRLKHFFSHSIYFEILSIFLIFIYPEEITIKGIIIGKHLFILPILTGTLYCFYKIFKELLHIFSHPTINP
ncbi:MAG: hypothetical protein D3918_12355 [Candidatus Electrothrix sp. AX2]|nr:hypothetical protein [Candidatus Electrothrix gigas]